MDIVLIRIVLFNSIVKILLKTEGSKILAPLGRGKGEGERTLVEASNQLKLTEDGNAWRAFEGNRNRLTMPAVFVPFQKVENFLLSIGKAYRISETPKLCVSG